VIIMSPTISTSLLDAALALPPDARAELADILLDSLDQSLDPRISDAVAEEAERRIDEYESGEVAALSQEEFEAWRRAKWNS
jgi:putative addiction module component (TIGR02574 family)